MSVSVFLAAVRSYGASLVNLAIVEAKQAALNFAVILGCAVAGALLAVTAWLALVGWLIALLVETDLLGWVGAFFLAMLLSLGGAAAAVFTLLRFARNKPFQATYRQLIERQERHETVLRRDSTSGTRGDPQKISSHRAMDRP